MQASELGLNTHLGVCLCCDSICFLFILSLNHPPLPKLQTQILPWAQMLGNLCPGLPSALQSAMLTEIETGVRRHSALESPGGGLVSHPHRDSFELLTVHPHLKRGSGTADDRQGAAEGPLYLRGNKFVVRPVHQSKQTPEPVQRGGKGHLACMKRPVTTG